MFGAFVAPHFAVHDSDCLLSPTTTSFLRIVSSVALTANSATALLMRSSATQAALFAYDAHQLARALSQVAAVLCYARLVHTVEVNFDILYRVDEDLVCANRKRHCLPLKC